MSPPTPPTRQIRIGIAGLGVMGLAHAKNILAGNAPRLRLTAVCDRKASTFALDPAVKIFPDSRTLIRSGEIDALLVATPHYSHTTIGIDALENGLHLLVEKPISVHKRDAEKLIAAHAANPAHVFAVMFNQRTDPFYQKIRDLIRAGELGEIRRVNWIITNWFRTAA
jgi:predicted dehydrogenase